MDFLLSLDRMSVRSMCLLVCLYVVQKKHHLQWRKYILEHSSLCFCYNCQGIVYIGSLGSCHKPQSLHVCLSCTESEVGLIHANADLNKTGRLMSTMISDLAKQFLEATMHTKII